jgi:hypothetical protein
MFRDCTACLRLVLHRTGNRGFLGSWAMVEKTLDQSWLIRNKHKKLLCFVKTFVPITRQKDRRWHFLILFFIVHFQDWLRKVSFGAQFFYTIGRAVIRCLGFAFWWILFKTLVFVWILLNQRLNSVSNQIRRMEHIIKMFTCWQLRSNEGFMTVYRTKHTDWTTQ